MTEAKNSNLLYGIDVYTTLDLRLALPPARARVFAGLDWTGARCTANAGETLVVQLVIGQLVCTDILPDFLFAPVNERCNLDQIVSLIPGNGGRLAAGFGLVTANGCGPGRAVLQRSFQWHDLA